MHVRRLPLENQIMVSGGEGIGSFKRVKKGYSQPLDLLGHLAAIP